jgi:lipopolysaccharide/colanic/teichoic acid biosynthesis glycosyltransferase
MYRFFLKRVLDIILSLLGLFIFGPFFFAIVLLLMIYNNGKPFFIQRRPGKNEKIFKIIKFKTMNDKKGEDGELLSDSDRLTGLGEFIRKTSFDEIPQLINVLKGDMSLIGPRPLLPEYLPLYNSEQKKRHNVKPGITGWAQINGRNDISWEDKLKYDIWYVNNISLLVDVKIFFKTFLKVFKSEGVSKEGEVTTTKFLGDA